MDKTDEKPIGWLALLEDGSVRCRAASVRWYLRDRGWKGPLKLYKHKGVAARYGKPLPVYLSDCLRREAELND